jgi:hypothetical protein
VSCPSQHLKLSDVATEVSVNDIRPQHQPMHRRTGPTRRHRRDQSEGLISPNVPN